MPAQRFAQGVDQYRAQIGKKCTRLTRYDAVESVEDLEPSQLDQIRRIFLAAQSPGQASPCKPENNGSMRATGSVRACESPTLI